VLAGSAVLAASFFCFISSRASHIYGGAVLLSIGNGLMWPSVMSLLSVRAGSRYQGTVQGFAGSSGALASVLGMVVGGILFDNLGAQIFAVSGTTIALVFVLAIVAATTSR